MKRISLGWFATLLLSLTSLSCTSESKVCSRMESLCGTTRSDCQELLKATKESFGDEGVAGLNTCFAEGNSCPEATGCVAGKGLKNVADAMGDFLKGMLKSVQEK